MRRRLLRCFAAFSFALIFACSLPPARSEAAKDESGVPFSFHMPSEPGSIDPARAAVLETSYLLANIRRGLYRFEGAEALSGSARRTQGLSGKGLQPEDAQWCKRQSARKLSCRLRAGLRWSDGSPILAQDYVRAFRRLVAPDARGAGAELLSRLKNARDAHAGRAPPETLGARAVGKRELEFEFERDDPDFLYKLCSSLLAPAKPEAVPPAGPSAASAVLNGPYRIQKWIPGKRVRLESNPHFRAGEGASLRPPVEIVFVDDDETAFDLYRKGELAYLRRLPTTYLNARRGGPDFFQVASARFDYIGFGPELGPHPKAREAFALSLDYEELGRIYQSHVRPGCPGVAEELMDGPNCLNFDLPRAKAAWASLPPEMRAHRWVYKFNKLGGEDLKKGAEWLQAQWRKHLGARVELEQTENGLLLAELRRSPPALFRKGVGLDRPTCLSALETFAPEGPENFLRVRAPEYGRVLAALAASSSPVESRKLCGKGIRLLTEGWLMIPQGRMYFTILASTSFQGWQLNEMNQLDLAGLRRRPE